MKMSSTPLKIRRSRYGRIAPNEEVSPALVMT